MIETSKYSQSDRIKIPKKKYFDFLWSLPIYQTEREKPGLFYNIKFYVKRTVFRAIKWVEANITKRYHIINCKNRFYKGGWADSDYLMVYSMFECLRRFVEEEEGLTSLEYQVTSANERIKNLKVTEATEEDLADALLRSVEYATVVDEIKDLYKWWTETRVEAWTDEEYEIDSKNMIRLVKVRPYLWT